MATLTKTSRTLAGMDGIFSRLKDQMRKFQVGLSVWDASGKMLSPPDAGCGACRMIRQSNGDRCDRALAHLSQRVLAGGKSASDPGPLGCCLVGVPIYKRRRLLGAAVGCFVVRQMLAGPGMAALQKGLGWDDGRMVRLAQEGCRRDEHEDEDVLRILDGLLKRDQALEVADGELLTLSANLSTTYEELNLLYRISGSVKVTQHPRAFFENVCTGLLEVMNVESVVAVAYSQPPAMEDDLVVSAGSVDLNAEQILLLSAGCIAPRLKGSHKSIVDNRFVGPEGSGLGVSVKNLVAAPVIADEVPMGMLIAFNKLSGEFDSVDMKLVNSVANQSAVFLNNYKLYTDLQDLLMGVLHALTATIDAKDPYTCGHSRRVALISRKLAQEMEFDADKVQEVYLAGLLHDIGKIGIPESILCKAGRLTDEEYNNLKRHPTIAAKILSGIRQLESVIGGILTHHERPDGRGYPQGLKAADIPIEGMIVSLADGFDAMTSDRTYRKALKLSLVVDEIKNHVGEQFDERVVEKMLSLDLAKLLQDIHQPETNVVPVSLARELKS